MKKESTSRKLGKLEALRGFAAFYVMLGHVFSGPIMINGIDFSFLLDFGQEAVILFFVLSGFVIQYSFEKARDKSFKLFFAKRFLRIYIPLLIVFLLNYILACVEHKGLFNPNWAQLTGNILMLQDASALKTNVVCDFFLGNSPLWSLSYEWWFYMVFFFIVTRYKKQASSIIYLLGVISAISYIFYPNFINRVLMYLTIWWVGADMALLYLKGEDITLKSIKTAFLTLLLITGILVLNVFFNKEKLAQQLGHSTIGISPYLELRHFGFAVFAIGGAIAWKKIKWLFFKPSIGLFEPFAQISFGVYISHWFLIAKASYLDEIVANVYIRYTLYFAICFLFAFIVEKKIYPYLSVIFFDRNKPKQEELDQFPKQLA